MSATVCCMGKLTSTFSTCALQAAASCALSREPACPLSDLVSEPGRFDGPEPFSFDYTRWWLTASLFRLGISIEQIEDFGVLRQALEDASARVTLLGDHASDEGVDRLILSSYRVACWLDSVVGTGSNQWRLGTMESLLHFHTEARYDELSSRPRDVKASGSRRAPTKWDDEEWDIHAGDDELYNDASADAPDLDRLERQMDSWSAGRTDIWADYDTDDREIPNDDVPALYRQPRRAGHS